MHKIAHVSHRIRSTNTRNTHIQSTPLKLCCVQLLVQPELPDVERLPSHPITALNSMGSYQMRYVPSSLECLPHSLQVHCSGGGAIRGQTWELRRKLGATRCARLL